MQDFDRTLNQRGIQDAEDMAALLKKRIAVVDRFFSSSAKRAHTTALQFAASYQQTVELEKGLYLAPASFFEDFISGIRDQFQTVALVAHNPGITDFANTLTTTLKTDNIPTCGIFAVRARVDAWKEFITAQKDLLFYDYPKLHR